jgi:AraC family transcriptional regulator
MKIAGRGRILIWEGGSLWLMEALPARGSASNMTAFHSHHAIQITLSLGGRFEFRTRDSSVAGDAVVAPDVEHLFEASGHVAVLFVEPESKSGRAIARSILDGATLRSIQSEKVADLVGQLEVLSRKSSVNEQELEGIGRSLIERLTGVDPVSLPDARVRKMIDHVATRLDDTVSLGSAAKIAGLSPSRARHLFVEQTGLPFRSYLLWLRITKAVAIMATGSTLTEAAHEAGFADSAHFSRTFRRMFGIPAAALQLT